MNSERMMDWVDRVAHRLIRRAARRAPDALSERLEEEWLADLADRRGRLSRLRFALGCCWATNIIAQDRELGLLPATAGSAVGRGLGSWPLLPTAWRRPVAFLVVAGLHIGVFYAFVIGLEYHFHGTKIAPLEPVPVPRQPKEVLPPLPPPQVTAPKLNPLFPDMLPPTTDDRPQVVSPPPDAPHSPTVPFEPPQPPPTHVVAHVPGGPGNGFPAADDFYPSASIHSGEMGAAKVKVCVDTKGRLTGAPSIEESSGITRLDEAAVNLAKAGSGHYRPSTDDGRPVDSCYAFRVRFNLRN